MQLSVREMNYRDVEQIANYWLGASHSFLVSMGVDVKLLPGRDVILHNLLNQLQTPLEKRNAYCLIWEADGSPVGHCNTNPTYFGDRANMHLHLWQPKSRKKGMGTELVRLSLPLFFERLQLKTLLCEPYALNPAPNKTLEKLGFTFIKEYNTVPGSINFEQPVKQWIMTRDQFSKLYPG